MININKFISSSGYSSRRQADRLIKEGKVLINGKLAKPTDKVTRSDKVEVLGKIIPHSKPKSIYLLFNKPVGVICTTDINAKDNIMNFIPIKERVFPVGRLDVKSSGLIILTNDGELANIILKSKKVEKEYFVKVNKPITEKALEKMANGIMIDGFKTLPAKIEKLSTKEFSITIVEGRKRQIRRMCEKLGYEVMKLQRVRIGNLTIDEVKEKTYKHIDEKLIKELLELN